MGGYCAILATTPLVRGPALRPKLRSVDMVSSISNGTSPLAGPSSKRVCWFYRVCSPGGFRALSGNRSIAPSPSSKAMAVLKATALRLRSWLRSSRSYPACRSAKAWRSPVRSIKTAARKRSVVFITRLRAFSRPVSSPSVSRVSKTLSFPGSMLTTSYKRPGGRSCCGKKILNQGRRYDRRRRGLHHGGRRGSAGSNGPVSC